MTIATLQRQPVIITPILFGQVGADFGDGIGSVAPSPPTDPYYSSVVLLANFDGANGATTFNDQKSSLPATFVGNAQLSTAQFKFGTASARFDGTSDIITFADSASWTLSSSNSDQYTIEGFVYFNTLTSANRGIMGHANSSLSQTAWIISGTSTPGEMFFTFTTDGTTLQSVTTVGAALTTGVWYAFAVDKDATGKIRVYVDGVMLGSSTPANSAIFNASVALTIGAQGANSAVDMDGWVDEVRITKGVARYASDSGYTVTTSAFPTQ